MELKRYLEIVRRRWWLVACAFVIATGATVALVLPQPWVYEAKGTLLLRPRGGAADSIDATDLLIRGVTIAATYATVAQSDLIQERAQQVLGSDIDVSDVSVRAEVLTDTNILSVIAQGQDRDATLEVAEEIARQTVLYVDGLDDAYVLTPLDAPSSPRTPSGPNKQFTMALGAFFGLTVGIALALFAHYLRGTPQKADGVTDEDTELYNEGFIRQRVREEMSRTDRTDRPFSFATLSVAIPFGENGDATHAPVGRDLRRIAGLLRLTAREESVVAHLGNGVFAALLPDVAKAEADAALTGWEAGISSLVGSTNEEAAGVRLSVGACEYRDRKFVGDRDTARELRRLLEPGSKTRTRAAATTRDSSDSSASTSGKTSSNSSASTTRKTAPRKPRTPRAATQPRDDNGVRGKPADDERGEPANDEPIDELVGTQHEDSAAARPAGRIRNRREASWKGAKSRAGTRRR